jgi:hypothetical protein
MRSESDGRLTNRSEGKGLNVLPCRAPRYDDTWQLARHLPTQRLFYHTSSSLGKIASGDQDGEDRVFPDPTSVSRLEASKQQSGPGNRSRERVQFMPSHFQEFPRFAKIRQDLPIFAKAVAPTGVLWGRLGEIDRWQLRCTCL